MRLSKLALPLLIFIFCSSNLVAAPFWDADLIANSSSEYLQLKDQSGKVYTSIKTGTVREIIAAKNKVEEAAGSIRAQLWIDAEEKPNAFATYNNNQPMIAINVGMIRILEEEEEAYAALIGHELAHLYLGHPAKYANRNGLKQAGSLVLGFALGYAGVPAGGTIADVATNAISTVFSRDDERDADAEGMKYMLQAGYDPYGAVHMQEKLANASEFSIPFLSSHPSGSERIKDMKKLAEIANASKTAYSDTKTIDGENRDLSKPVTAQAEAAQVPASIPAMVRIPGKNYEIGKYEVTQAEWRTVMGNNPSYPRICGDCPVVRVSWNDAQEFIGKLNAKNGKQYRLPTEAEWEYACYGGSQTEYCGGNDVDAVAWTSANSQINKSQGPDGKPLGYFNGLHPVGQKQSNGYGLYDMSGNVWEWMNDCDQDHCMRRMVGGGSYYDLQQSASATSRELNRPEYRDFVIGFRLARTIDAPSTEPVVATPPAAPVVATPSSNTLPTQGKSAADRIRFLNSLYKEGVINQKDFETKKQEILKSM